MVNKKDLFACTLCHVNPSLGHLTKTSMGYCLSLSIRHGSTNRVRESLSFRTLDNPFPLGVVRRNHHIRCHLNQSLESAFSLCMKNCSNPHKKLRTQSRWPSELVTLYRLIHFFKVARFTTSVLPSRHLYRLTMLLATMHVLHLPHPRSPGPFPPVSALLLLPAPPNPSALHHALHL